MSDSPVKSPPAALADRDGETETVRALLSSTTWSGPWEPPERMRLVAVLGNIVLDYRDTDLPLGVTLVDCEVYLGSVEIVVPPDVDVELTGSVTLGSVETRRGMDGRTWRRRARELLTGSEEEELERPLLSVACSGVMGSIEVKLP